MKNYKKRPKKENVEEKAEVSCPECNSTEFSHDSSRAEVTCKHCGLVIDENMMDRGPEWRSFDFEQQKSRARAGAPSTGTIHDGGLSTVMGFKRNGSPEDHAKWYRMRKLNKRARIANSRERNLAFALSELDRKCSNMGLNRSIREASSRIYRNALEANLIRGRTIEGVVAASIYIACRQSGLPRTLDEVAQFTAVNRKNLARIERFLKRELNIKLLPPSATDYIPRFASQLELSNKSEAKAIEIVNESNDFTSGKGPQGVAAAALYISSILLGERKSQKDVAEAAGVTEVTVRNRYKEISENLNLAVA